MTTFNERLAEAMSKDFEQSATDSLTLDRGYSFPTDETRKVVEDEIAARLRAVADDLCKVPMTEPERREFYQREDSQHTDEPDIYDAVRDLQAAQLMTHEGFLAFHDECCQKMRAICEKKNSDYTAGSDDAFYNFRQVEQMGISSAEQGFLTRMTDKFSRLVTFVKVGVLKVSDESVTDTLLDLANYCILLAGYIKSKRLAPQQNEREVLLDDLPNLRKKVNASQYVRDLLVAVVERTIKCSYLPECSDILAQAKEALIKDKETPVAVIPYQTK